MEKPRRCADDDGVLCIFHILHVFQVHHPQFFVALPLSVGENGLAVLGDYKGGVVYLDISMLAVSFQQDIRNYGADETYNEKVGDAEICTVYYNLVQYGGYGHSVGGYNVKKQYDDKN